MNTFLFDSVCEGGRRPHNHNVNIIHDVSYFHVMLNGTEIEFVHSVVVDQKYLTGL